MDKVIKIEPSNLVVIRVEQERKCYGEVTLRNIMHTMPVAFKIQPKNKTQTRFNIRPQSGIIAPRSTTKVEILYNISQNTIISESVTDYNESFRLHSIVAPCAMVKTFNPFSNPNDSVPSEWFANKNTQVFIDSGLRVMLVGSRIISRLVCNGNVDEIRELLEKSDPTWNLVDSIDENGQTLLHLAIAQSRPDIFKLLLEFLPDVEAHSRSGFSPLEAAAASGEAQIVELLLAHKAGPERVGPSAADPIHFASWAGHLEILRLILLKGANINALTQNDETALHLAVEKRNRDCIMLLLENGALTDFQKISDGDTALHIASMLGDEETVNILLKYGAKKEIRNRLGNTAYDIAFENGFTKLFDILWLGDCLSLASRKGEIRAIQRLIEDGAFLNGSDQNGWTALHRASYKGKIETVKMLVEKGIDVNSKDDEGYTALHCAVEGGHADVATYLLKKGAILEGKTNKCVTALQISDSHGYVGISKILEHENNQDIFDCEISFKDKMKGKEVVFDGTKKRGKNSRNYNKLLALV